VTFPVTQEGSIIGQDRSGKKAQKPLFHRVLPIVPGLIGWAWHWAAAVLPTAASVFLDRGFSFSEGPRRARLS
jgi:hypothetical protein